MSTSGKRAQNKERIRASLLKEAQRLFSKKGFDQTTVADIVEACQIGRGTFYNYYEDVKDIFDAVVDQITSEIHEHIKEGRRDVKGIYNFLYASFMAYFDFVSQPQMKSFHKKNLSYIRSTSYGSKSNKKFILDLQKDIKERGMDIDFKFNADHEVHLFSHILVGAPTELFLNSLVSKKKISTNQMADFLAKLLSLPYQKI